MHLKTDKSLTLPNWFTCDNIVDLFSSVYVLHCILVVCVAVFSPNYISVSILFFLYDSIINKKNKKNAPTDHCSQIHLSQLRCATNNVTAAISRYVCG